MKEERVELLIKQGDLRMREVDLEKVKSIVESAEINAKVVKKLALDRESATVIFRELYESIRQLGDAKWGLLGYEPRTHEVSMDILQEADIKEKVMLNYLPRFKRIRNDANYRGFKVSVEQAKEITDFWNKCSGEILSIIKARFR